jgi:hypothetical protein
LPPGGDSVSSRILGSGPYFETGAKSQIPAHLTKLALARDRLAGRQIAIC